MTADVEHRQGCPATGGYGRGVESCICGAVADVELPPLPEDYDQNPAGNAEIQDYARACVAHVTAAKDAEIEASAQQPAAAQQGGHHE